jgi:hypothetical protein
MTKTTIVTALRLILSLAIAGPVQARPGQSGTAIARPSGIDCMRDAGRAECDALTAAFARKHAHSHIRKTEHATIPLRPARLPDPEGDPLASMHFE